jgi:hypothetical protein
VSEKSHLESVLQGLSIGVSSEYRQEIEDSQELKEQESILRTVCRGGLDEHVVEHDAFHRVFILKIRGQPRYHYSDAIAWFLTNDGKLPSFDREARTRAGQTAMLPFCLTSSEWVQLNRPFLSRTENAVGLDEFFHFLVTQPYVRSVVQTFSLAKARNEVLVRAARYRNLSPQLALSLVADSHFVIMNALEPNETKADEMIESKFIEVANALEAKNAQLSNQLREHDQEIKALGTKLSQVSDSAVKTEQALRDQVQQLQASVEGEREDGKKSREEAGSARATNRMLRWVLAVVCAAVLSLVLWTNHAWLRWSWLAGHGNRVFILIDAQIVILLALLNIPLSRQWKTWLAMLGAAVLAMVTLCATHGSGQ